MRVDNSQTESSSNGGINTGALFPQDLEAQRCTPSDVRHHCPLVKDLEICKRIRRAERRDVPCVGRHYNEE